MLDRCYNKNHQAYSNYGGRGIRVQRSWHDYSIFAEYVIQKLGDRPKDYELDRIDNEKGYVAGNVRWSPAWLNTSNTRKGTKIIYNKQEIPLREYYEIKADQAVVSYDIFSDRYAIGWKAKAALTIPKGTRFKLHDTGHLR